MSRSNIPEEFDESQPIKPKRPGGPPPAPSKGFPIAGKPARPLAADDPSPFEINVHVEPPAKKPDPPPADVVQRVRSELDKPAADLAYYTVNEALVLGALAQLFLYGSFVLGALATAVNPYAGAPVWGVGLICCIVLGEAGKACVLGKTARNCAMAWLCGAVMLALLFLGAALLFAWSVTSGRR